MKSMENTPPPPPPPPLPPSPPTSIGGSQELQCVGRLEIVSPKPVGFLCGSIPVPTDNSFNVFNSALVPSTQTVIAPRYRVLPMETDLNTPPLVSNLPEKGLPIGAVHSKATGDISWEGSAIASNHNRKCEALAVAGLVEYGDDIDVIASADILKQIFKIPYSKARLSIAVRRVGQTLILNAGPDVEEGDLLVRRHKNQSKGADQSLLLNFAMHSVRMEACDCPPTHRHPSEDHSSSSVLPGMHASHFVQHSNDVSHNNEFKQGSECSNVKQDSFLWGRQKGKRNKGHDPIQKASHIGETPRYSVQEPEKNRRVGSNGFLRALFWQFHNFRMLLGSDLLLFSNEKYVAVSLHLWDVTRQVTPLTWLEAWLDNIMASVPELAICYHQNGVVQGYELLKTDDIFLLKGISEDGTPAFHPHVVQQNGLSVLRFLQENCKQDPGAYWLYKSAGEDAIQLFDLSVIPKNHSSTDCGDSSSTLPSLIRRRRSDSLYSLGTLLYRIAHRLSLSMAPNNRAKCAKFFRKCLDFLNDPDHLVVRAFAHEEFARLILNHDEELDLTSESFPVECEVTVTDAEEEHLDPSSEMTESIETEPVPGFSVEEKLGEDWITDPDSPSNGSVQMNLEANVLPPRNLIASAEPEEKGALLDSNGDPNVAVCTMSSTPTCVVTTVTDPISSKLAAVHHVSQAIKSLRWMRQLQNTEPELVDQSSSTNGGLTSSMDFTVCACGDADCIEVCDIWDWLPTSKLDNKLWKLVLLLGESYLALGDAYKEDGQLHQALKVLELACSVYGSVPQQLEDSKFISSMRSISCQQKFSNEPVIDEPKEASSCSSDDSLTLEQLSSTYLFWAKAWVLVGDIYVAFHKLKDKEISKQAETRPPTKELRMSSEVVKEVKRLKRKLAFNQNCSSCSLVNCSCQSDRASSGSSASSSSGGKRSVGYTRKSSKRSHAKGVSSSSLGDVKDDCTHLKAMDRQTSDSGHLQHNGDGGISAEVSKYKGIESSLRMHYAETAEKSQAESTSTGVPQVKNGGIFKYIEGPIAGDAEHNLSVALICYEEARKVLSGLPAIPAIPSEIQSLMKKKGWVCNELGRNRLERKELNKAELAFAEAVTAFREVSDHTNVILINCNLGHGRRALAEEMASKIEGLKTHTIFYQSYKKALDSAKLEYSKSLRYYGAAKSELNAITEEADSMLNSLSSEVYTQFGHTYLRLGMLLAKEDTTVEIYEEDANVPCNLRARTEFRKHEISANDAIREALSLYESQGELRKQEAAYAYFKLACYQRDCCLKFLDPDAKSKLPKGENNILHRVKQYASLVERNCQKAMDFYSPKTHPTMYLTILLEKSVFLSTLSSSLHQNAMLESSLVCLLEARNISEYISETNNSEVHDRYWRVLQIVLKKMLTIAHSATTNKYHTTQPAPIYSSKSGDVVKLRELYKMSLKSKNLCDLHAMHTMWTS